MPSSKPKPWAGFRSVLCPVDFSEHSRQALRYAEAVAAGEGIQLFVTALRDRRGWFGAKRGSVSYHVLSHAVAPVLAYALLGRPR